MVLGGFVSHGATHGFLSLTALVYLGIDRTHQRDAPSRQDDAVSGRVGVVVMS